MSMHFDAVVPLSSAQERMWFMDQLEPGSVAYLMPWALWLHGALDAERMAQAVHAVAEQHQSLSWCFADEAGHPVQHRSAPLTLEIRDVIGADLQQARAQALRQAEQEARTSIDLSGANLWKAILFKVAADQHLLLIICHQIIFDSASFRLLLDDLAAAYAGGQERGEPPAPYAAYTEQERAWLGSDACAAQIAYWTNQLADLEPLTITPDRVRPPTPSSRGARITERISAAAANRVTAFAQAHQAEPQLVYLTAFAALIARSTGASDIPIAIPVSLRGEQGFARTIGPCINTLILRISSPDGQRFGELFAVTHKAFREARANQELPYNRVIRTWRADGDLISGTVINLLFDVRDPSPLSLAIPGIASEVVELDNGSTVSDLVLTIALADGAANASLRYSSELYEEATVRRLLAHFLRCLEGIDEQGSCPLASLPLLSPAEYHQLVVEWNQTRVPFDENRCLHQLFEDQVARTPREVALIYRDERLTYQTLNRRANRLAKRLIAAGAGKDRLIGILLDRGIELVIAIIAVLKAGAAYVPLDRKATRERLAFIAADAQLLLIISGPGHADAIPAGVAVLPPGEAAEAKAGEYEGNPATAVAATSLAYVIYTSGSTGAPKGVMIEHRSAVNAVLATIERYRFLAVDRTLFQSSITFDSSVSKIFQSLCNGGALVVAPEEADFDEILELTGSHGIPRLTTTPSELAILNATPERIPPCIQIIGAAGENLSPSDVDQILPRLPILNIYGPTEATISTTMFRLTNGAFTAAGTVPIGKPIMNYQVYILDRAQNPLPIGSIGEIYIGGVGLARGYLGAPELTASKFIPNPFAPGQRLYRSGDLGRWLADGNIEFRGRSDMQVKIRGHRIEPGEIEATLRQHPSVQQALVMVRESGINAYLAGYVVQTPDPAVPMEELKGFLRRTLPEYMIPVLLMRLDAFPIQPSGKIDRAKFPDIESQADTTCLNPPTTPAEELLCIIWQAVLGLGRVGINDNFFDLGGNSLLSLQVVARAKKAGLPLSPRMIFAHPTISALTNAAQQADHAPGQAKSLIIPIQTQGSRIPFFFIGGFLDVGRHLGPDQPFYGLDCPAEAKTREITFLSLAQRCVADILAIQQHGPYLLGGHGFGAIVSFSIAELLIAAGEHVAFLGLFDPPTPPRCQVSPRLLDRVRFHFRALGHFDTLGKISYIRQRFANVRNKIASAWRGEGNIQIYDDFEPNIFPGTLTVYIAGDTYLSLRPDQDPRLMWKAWARDGIRLYECPGDHITFCREPQALNLGQQLRAHIDAALRGTATIRRAPSTRIKL